MSTIKQWRVEVMIGEDSGHTYAEARLVGDAPRDLIGVGRAHVSPEDYDVPEIGEEVAAARALRDLAEQLFATASADITDVTLEDVYLTR